ncbi:MAG TPA: alpha/beta fold hydrolase [Rhodospirillales bacterium]|jgi:esterase/lipase/1-acyl-sn-glycerol-3-phosphate acyltransferase|nr:alpha/beta fold hydrolase [Rhodospirillales bacterium]
MDVEEEFELNTSIYEWAVRAISVIGKRLGVKIRFHHKEDQIDAGQIFLFNHFARFETFIPQYLIFQETGAFCRSIAAGELFEGGDAFARFLIQAGAIPHDHPRLLPILAEEILHGRKVIIFPEGGMVKDRLVIDRSGRYRIYSRTARERRKHHTGAAVLALVVAGFKQAILLLHAAGNSRQLGKWARKLKFDGVDALLAAADRATFIVPSNITFYPIRVSDNILRQGVELFTGGLSKRISEELLIESNILLKETDMDLRLGECLTPAKRWPWWKRKLFCRLIRRFDGLDALFDLKTDSGSWDERLVARTIGRQALKVRDAYMREMYDGVTINLSHLASRLMLMFVDRGQMEVDCSLFHKILFLAIKKAQKETSIHLHHSLLNPEKYSGLLAGECLGFEQLIASEAASELVELKDDRIHFLPKLCEEHGFDEIRLENLISVYANEIAPITAAKRALERALDGAPEIDEPALARLLFDDEHISYLWSKQSFDKPRYDEINRQETANKSAAPYMLLPDGGKPLGIVLVHGFLASPAEMRPLAEKLAAASYPVIAVRLPGHGTSPWDLRGRSWPDWLEAVRRGYRIMSAFAPRICVVGFSTGGSLALLLAAEHPVGLAGIASVSAPLKFMNRNLIFVPLVYGANKLTRWLTSFEGVMPFRPNESEHPDINYRNVPLRGLYELRNVVEELEDRLPEVECPAMIIQATKDHIVDPVSARLIHDRLGSGDKTLRMIASERHGILNENTDGCQEKVIEFISSLSPPPSLPEGEPG